MSADGGPAFPTRVRPTPTGDFVPTEGMSLHDWYAGKAMEGLLASHPGALLPRPETLAAASFDMADAMIAERSRR